MILYTTDKEFLLSIGVAPYDPEHFAEEQRERLRTRILQAVAILQLTAIMAGLVWTSL